ncbi:MAG: CBS domain-containing protein [Anaerolineales bacterium]
MHLVFTHEQADFDAVASLWAAARLEPGSIAVLPHALNRNVESYLNRYGDRFAFANPDDFQLQMLDQLTLVATQAAPSTEMIEGGTVVRVIDRHPPEAGLDPAWSVRSELVGATSTLLVEDLHGRDESLPSEAATLMLLGIYEKTSSLTGPGTTARDARAAGWLLEQGVNLGVAGAFLNFPELTQPPELYPPPVEGLQAEYPGTVSEIMSRGPRLLRPTVTVRQAADLMQRFGHEGYPVTDDGQVVGLLTRRAVDRAMAHGMDARPISEIMEAGSLVVHPEDSVRHLQQLMIEHQWGQVPVADPKSGEVIGIVTRTDLLNSLSRENHPNGSESIAARLERALPAGKLALLKLIAGEAERAGSALYLVGGFVRDLLLDAPGADFDLVVEGDAIRLATSLASKFGGKVYSHQRFGTAEWWLDPDHASLHSAIGLETAGLPETLDLVSARTEFYPYPSALPSVAEGSIKLDLHRRDFSINTLALRLDGDHYGQLLDYWGGGRDLGERQIRVLHSLSFVDDPTRMLRAVRLEQRLGFSIEGRTLQLVSHALPLLSSVSGERIRAELADIFGEPQVNRILARLAELGLLHAIHPALDWDDWSATRFTATAEFIAPADWRLGGQPSQERLKYALWLYRLPRPEADSVCARLAFSQIERTVILSAGRHGCAHPGNRPASQVVACLEPVPEESLVAEWLALQAGAEARLTIEQFLSEWRWVRQRTDGTRLRQLGVAPGPAYRLIMDELRAGWLDGQIGSEAEEQTLLKQLIEQHSGHG